MLERDLAEALARRAAEREQRIAVDLERCEIHGLTRDVVVFEINQLRRQSLLRGLDPIAATLEREARIASFQEKDRHRRPWAHLGNPG